MYEFLTDFGFSIRGHLDLEDIKTKLCELFHIEADKFISYTTEWTFSQDALFYEYWRTDKGFKTNLILHMIGDYWEKYRYEDSIFDLGVMFADIFKQDVVVALYKPIAPNISDWVLIRPDGSTCSVIRNYHDDYVDFIEKDALDL